ncbi:hypothetical protein BJ875DRAFT_447336 [Amylocarpus encephaloides]|uniref:ABM domain-containing protein n=1 Tax=Amylocarpus encephaloides TaxID=45428 RepID=A0A9P7YUJ8_9HELO|nr:hypothetical protein BJ875DRAFT_447336 [Amylocarpus encephaloides]
MSLPNPHPHSSPIRITEVAILPLNHPNPVYLPYYTLDHLAMAKNVLEASSGHTFTYYRSLNEPPALYLFGSWDSFEAHAAFLPSPVNLELLKLLKDDLRIDAIQMWHLDADIFKVEEGRKSILEAGTLGFGRYIVPDVEEFLEKYGGLRENLIEVSKCVGSEARYQVTGGLKIEQRDVEEWDMFYRFDGEDGADLSELQFSINEAVRETVVQHLKRLELV